ncbi:MAG TPA: FtsH protease activity modulator HflK [Steroidobacteraceae bacterium]|nr:FtsH protease activity modulator HflK [Steroidobacteraceae bacterium]
MTWNRSGGGNSSGRRPERGGTALDEKVKHWQRKIETLLNPATETTGSIAGTVVLVAVALWLGSGFFQVGAAERGVLLRFGSFVQVRGEGPGWHFPWPIETLRKVNVMSVASKEVNPTVLTSDSALVDLRVDVQYRRADPLKFLFGVRDPEETLHEVSESAMRDVVGRGPLAEVLAGADRAQITSRAKALIQSRLDEYGTGIEVTSVNLIDVQVPEAVVAAQRDANKAVADRERDIEEAHAYESSVVPTARGDADKIHEDAEAYKARMVALAEGNASLFSQIEAAYAKAPQVTRERLYLETMEDVLDRANKVVVESKAGAGGNLIYLPLDKLIGRGGTSPNDADAASASPPASASAPTDGESVTVEGDRSRGQR